ncbi:DinB family protein [Acidiferrimicrobium sp. IK]|nr:DinB family protein [Acidiferrimicrobium sp. IK]
MLAGTTLPRMRWGPENPVCAECGFDWAVPASSAIDIVAACPATYAAALAGVSPRPAAENGRWSAGMYLWHVVDVLHIGVERLWTITLDPDTGIPCWDENGLAAARNYSMLSIPVGLHALRQATANWVTTATTTPQDLTTRHDLFGELAAIDILRRNAHEVQHHLLDITGRSLS